MNSFAGHGVNFEVGAAPKQMKKRSLAEIGMNNYKNIIEVDLELKLSLPGSNSSNLSNTIKATTLETTLPSSSAFHEPHIPSVLDIEENLGGTLKDDLPPLVVMGCARCLIYVMVSKVDPKCPSCKNSKLIDKFQLNPIKKRRTNRN
ncbi:hypothetical protein VNO78_21763 [Psophocarpus tetragonolobus]|uniref:GIR1-like zinc ribbon domain-containing protein n=1 Tax=Psophocarpus tetragonolobus TaxID=3891 RepID=A0AAN9SGZ6_PSOTE